MKKPILRASYALCLLVILFSCNSNDDADPIIPADSYASLSDLVESLKPDAQTITISDPTIAQTITGADGTEISIAANAFTDGNNDPITTPVTAKLNEYLSLENMILGNAQTESNGQILVTGGSFDLTFEDENGATANVNNPFDLQAKIPVQTNVAGLENDLQYYKGNRTTVDGKEIVDWELGQNSEAWFTEGAFNIAGLDQGLSNCDVLYDMTGDTPTQFEVTIDGVTDYSQSTVWMFIEDFPSIIMVYSLNDTEDALETYANSIPLGLNITLVAITVDADNYLKFGSIEGQVAGDDIFNVTTDYGTTAELSTLIQTIAN